jgi:hypothetical protein
MEMARCDEGESRGLAYSSLIQQPIAARAGSWFSRPGADLVLWKSKSKSNFHLRLISISINQLWIATLHYSLQYLSLLSFIHNIHCSIKQTLPQVSASASS